MQDIFISNKIGKNQEIGVEKQNFLQIEILYHQSTYVTYACAT